MPTAVQELERLRGKYGTPSAPAPPSSRAELGRLRSKYRAEPPVQPTDDRPAARQELERLRSKYAAPAAPPPEPQAPSAIPPATPDLREPPEPKTELKPLIQRLPGTPGYGEFVRGETEKARRGEPPGPGRPTAEVYPPAPGEKQQRWLEKNIAPPLVALLQTNPLSSTLLYKVVLPSADKVNPGFGERVLRDAEEMRRTSATRIPKGVPVVGGIDPIEEALKIWVNFQLMDILTPGVPSPAGPGLVPPPAPATAISTASAIASQGARTSALFGSLAAADKMRETGGNVEEGLKAAGPAMALGFGVGVTFGTILNAGQIRTLWQNRAFQKAQKNLARVVKTGRGDPLPYLAAKRRLAQTAKGIFKSRGDAAGVADMDRSLAKIAEDWKEVRGQSVLTEMRVRGAVPRVGEPATARTPVTDAQALEIAQSTAKRLALPETAVAEGRAVVGRLAEGKLTEYRAGRAVARALQAKYPTLSGPDASELAWRVQGVDNPGLREFGPITNEIYAARSILERAPQAFRTTVPGAAGLETPIPVIRAPAPAEAGPWFQRPAARAPSMAPELARRAAGRAVGPSNAAVTRAAQALARAAAKPGVTEQQAISAAAAALLRSAQAEGALVSPEDAQTTVERIAAEKQRTEREVAVTEGRGLPPTPDVLETARMAERLAEVEGAEYQSPRVSEMKTLEVMAELKKRHSQDALKDGYERWKLTPQGQREGAGYQGEMKEAGQLETFARLLLSDSPSAVQAMAKEAPAAPPAAKVAPAVGAEPKVAPEAKPGALPEAVAAEPAPVREPLAPTGTEQAVAATRKSVSRLAKAKRTPAAIRKIAEKQAAKVGADVEGVLSGMGAEATPEVPIEVEPVQKAARRYPVPTQEAKIGDIIEDLSGREWKVTGLVRRGGRGGTVVMGKAGGVGREMAIPKRSILGVHREIAAPSPGTAAEVTRYSDFGPRAIELPEIVELAQRIAGGKYPKVVKRLRAMKGMALGQFGAKAGIQLRADLFAEPTQAAAVLAHEVGHLVDWLPDEELKRGNILGRIATLKKYMKGAYEGLAKDAEIRTELRALTQKLKPFDEKTADPRYRRYRYSSKELYADAITALVNNPDMLRETAPKFYDGFFRYLDRKPEVKAVWDDIQNRLQHPETVYGERHERVREMFRAGEQALADASQRLDKGITPHGLWHAISRGFIDRNADVYRAEKALAKQGRPLPDEKRATYWMEEVPYIQGPMRVFTEKVARQVMAPAMRAGLTGDDISEYLFEARITQGDRPDIANPLGFSPQEAEAQLNYLRGKLGEKKFAALVEAQRAFYEIWQKYVVDEYAKANILDAAAIEKLRDAKYYATFDVQQAIEQRFGSLPSGYVHAQMGTLKPIAPPLAATVLKGYAMLRHAAVTRARRSVVELAREMDPESVTQAKRAPQGKRIVYLEPTDPALGLVMYMEAGKLHGLYIPKEMAEDTKADPFGTDLTIRAWRIGVNALKNVLVRYSPRFLAFNPFRDFARSYQNLPETAFFWHAWSGAPGLLIRYAQTLPSAAAEAVFGYATPTVETMYKGRMLIAGRYYRGDEPFEQYISRMMSSYGMGHTRAQWLKRIAAAPFTILDKIGQTQEVWGKVAAYKHLKALQRSGAIDWSDKKIAHAVRTWAGTPDPYRRGRYYALVESVYLFGNIKKEGWRGSLEAMAYNPKAWWWRALKTTQLPKLMLRLALLGLLGEGLRRVVRKINAYDLMGGCPVPIGETEDGKAIVFRLPQDDTQRVVGALTYMGLSEAFPEPDGEGQVGTKVQDFARMLYEETPVGGLNPLIEISGDALAYFAFGQNPFDEWRGEKIIPERNFQAGGLDSLKYFGAHVWNSLGGSAWYRMRAKNVEAVQSELEKALDLPGVGPVLSRFLRVTDRGEEERAQAVMESIRTEEARKYLRLRDRILDNINARIAEGKEPTAQDALKVYTQAAKDGLLDPAKRRFGQFQNTYNRYASRRFDNAKFDSVAWATTNAQKTAILRQFRRQMEEQEYREHLAQLLKEDLISKPVFAEAWTAAGREEGK